MSPEDCNNRLLALGSLISLASEVSGSAASRAEKAREDWLDDRSEDDTGAVGDRESHPEDEDELEGVVEGCETLARAIGRL